MPNRKRALTYFGATILDLLDTAHVPHYKFYEAIEITKVYFYEILSGIPPTQDVIDRMLDTFDTILPPDPNRRTYVQDQAARTRGEIPPDIFDKIRNHPDQWDKLRKLLNKHLS